MRDRKRSNPKTLAEQSEIQEPSAKYARNKEVPTFFGQPMVRGSFAQIDSAQLTADLPALFYRDFGAALYIYRELGSGHGKYMR